MILARIILGLLEIAPMSGYDIKRHFDTTINHFWSADKAQIYRTLTRLADDGLITAEKVAGSGAPDKQMHRITEQGRGALHRWLVSDLDNQPERDAFQARLFFAGALDDAELADLVRRRRTAVQSLLTTLEAMREQVPAPTDRRARLRLATLDNGITHARAELAWFTALEKELP